MFSATFCKEETQDRKWSPHMQIYILTYHMHCKVTAAPCCVWASLCYMQSTSSSSHKHVHTHTRTFSVPTSEEGGCVVVPGVTGSSSPQMTNRYNQLSRDPSCCCHSHCSWINTYIKQSGATGHYAAPTHIHTHNCYIFNTHMHAHTVTDT